MVPRVNDDNPIARSLDLTTPLNDSLDFKKEEAREGRKRNLNIANPITFN